MQNLQVKVEWRWHLPTGAPGGSHCGLTSAATPALCLVHGVGLHTGRGAPGESGCPAPGAGLEAALLGEGQRLSWFGLLVWKGL